MDLGIVYTLPDIWHIYIIIILCCNFNSCLKDTFKGQKGDKRVEIFVQVCKVS